MNKNGKHYNDLEEIQGIVGKIRGITINEAINFQEDFEDEVPAADPSAQGEMPDTQVDPHGSEGIEGDVEGGKNLASMQPDEEPDPENGLREMGDEVDAIREIALKGMIKLCKNPEDDRYQALKKIFTFCDKAAETKKEEQEN